MGLPDSQGFLDVDPARPSSQWTMSSRMARAGLVLEVLAVFNP